MAIRRAHVFAPFIGAAAFAAAAQVTGAVDLAPWVFFVALGAAGAVAGGLTADAGYAMLLALGAGIACAASWIAGSIGLLGWISVALALLTSMFVFLVVAAPGVTAASLADRRPAEPGD